MEISWNAYKPIRRTFSLTTRSRLRFNSNQQKVTWYSKSRQFGYPMGTVRWMDTSCDDV